MKKINFASFLRGAGAAQSTSMLPLCSLALLVLMGIGLITVHSSQLYRWYALSQRAHRIKKQEGHYRALCAQQTDIETKQQGLRAKMSALRAHQYAQEEALKKIELLCAVPITYLVKAHTSAKKFDITLTVAAQQEALQIVATLKQSPLVQRVRINHMTAHQGNYTVILEGIWK